MFFSHHEDNRKAGYRKGAWNDVIRYGEKELKQKPDDIKILNDVAFAYYMNRDYEHATKLCEHIYRLDSKPDLRLQAKEVGPRYMRYHEILADMYFLQGRDDEALAICNNLKILTSLFSKKHSIAAHIHIRRGNLLAAAREYENMAEKCSTHFKEAVVGLVDLAKIDPLEEMPYRYLYALYIQSNELNSIITRLEAICSAGQRDQDSLYSLIYMYYFSGSYEKEIQLLTQKIAIDTDDSHLHFFLAKAYQAKQESEKARQHIDRAIAMAPRYADCYTQLRSEMVSSEQSALQRLEEAIRKDVQERHPYKAIKGYEQLLKANPDHHPYWIGLAGVIDMAIDVEIAGGDFESAFKHLDQLKPFSGKYPPVKKIYEQRHAQLTPKRIEYYEGFICRKEGSAVEMNRKRLMLARLYIQRKDIKHAVQHWSEVIKGDGQERTEAMFQLASYLLKIGKIEMAEPYVQQFVGVSCDSEQIKGWMYALGVASEEAGLRSQARNLFGKLCMGNKEYRDVAQRLAALNKRDHSEEVPESVMVLDIFESSRMMDLYGDEATNKIKNMLEDLMFPVFEESGSKFCKSTGDGFLVTFTEVEHAVKTAIKILQIMDDYNAKKKGIPVHLRFAVHFGAVHIRQDGDRHGTNINIPFRVEGLKAENLIEVEGGMHRYELPKQDRILITEAAYQRLLTHEEYRSRYVGMFELRNITGAHKIYQVLTPELVSA